MTEDGLNKIKMEIIGKVTNQDLATIHPGALTKGKTDHII